MRSSPAGDAGGRSSLSALPHTLSDFLAEHGIADSAVALWRGYARYRAGAEGVEDIRRIDDGYERVSTGVIKFRTQVAGIAIPRRPLPWTKGSRPLAELRPDTPIRMRTRYHAHDDDPPGHEHNVEDPFRRCHKGKHEDCKRQAEHHRHDQPAKYIFAPKEIVEAVWLKYVWPPKPAPFRPSTGPYPVDVLSERVRGRVDWPSWGRLELQRRLSVELPPRVDTDEDRRSWGPKKYGEMTRRELGRIEVDGSTYVVHSQLRKARASEAMRVDAHPLAVEMLEVAERLYFGLEGCIKADAMLSAVRANGERASVVSVPSVTLWPKDANYYGGDLRTIAGFALPTVLVVDSDWDDFAKNRGAVFLQAARVQDRLRRIGLAHVAIAAPPSPAATGCTEHDKHGVDDYLGEGGALGALLVLSEARTDRMLGRLRDAYEPGEIAFEEAARITHSIALRARPDTGVATVGLWTTVHDIDDDPRPFPTGAAPLDGNRRQLAIAQKIHRTNGHLRRAGVRITFPKPEEYPTPTRYRLPKDSIPRPAVLGTLAEAGIPELSEPDFRLLPTCVECGLAIDEAKHADARMHRVCAARVRKRRQRDRQEGSH